MTNYDISLLLLLIQHKGDCNVIFELHSCEVCPIYHYRKSGNIAAQCRDNPALIKLAKRIILEANEAIDQTLLTD